jgi:RNA polymerase sigma-70 factor, ECF subfamily
MGVSSKMRTCLAITPTLREEHDRSLQATRVRDLLSAGKSWILPVTKAAAQTYRDEWNVAGNFDRGKLDGLMHAALAGDSAAYRCLLADISPRIRAMVRRSLERSSQGNADIEDIVQDVLLAVHLKRHTWDPALPLTPWLNAVTRHKIIDAMRRRGSAVTVALEGLEHALPDHTVQQPEHGDADRMLAALPEKQQRIVRAITLGDRAAADVGQELNMSEGAVRVALYRALKTLAQIYRKPDK